MTDGSFATGSGTGAASARVSLHGFVLLVLVVLSLLLRLQGTDWDQGHHLHPDERFLTMVAVDTRWPQSLGEYFDTRRSPLNPANAGHGFFVYGTLPLFLVKGLATAIGWEGYDRVHLVGRVLSALFAVGTVLLTYRLGILLAGRTAGLCAAALVTFCVLAIQQAHFFTVDTYATFFATVALLQLAKVALGGGRAAHILFGVYLGLTLACRLNLALLGLLYPIATLFAWRRRELAFRTAAAHAAVTGLAAAFVFRVVQPYAFEGPGLANLALAPDFLTSMASVRLLATGEAHIPPSVQWVGRLPIVFPGWNLLAWGLGPAWGLAACAGLAWRFVRRRPSESIDRVAVGRIVLLWAPLLFLFHGTQFVATGRYFLPIVPPLALAAGWWLAGIAPTSRRTRHAAIAAVIVLTAVWALGFSSIYRRPHTRVEASRWIYEHVAPGMAIATEHWDDRLPLALDGRSPGIYQAIELALYADEDERKRQDLIGALDAADIVVMSSNRLHASIPRTPWRYPLGRRYYELMFRGELGFELAAVFTSYPALGPFTIRDDGAEEAFTVYDHPRVLVFRKSSSYEPERVAALLQAVSLANVVRLPPREESALYRQMRPADVELPDDLTRHSAAAPAERGSISAVLRWLAVWQVLSLSCFALLFSVLPGAADRGYAFAKLAGWLLPGAAAWLMVSVGILPGGTASSRITAIVVVMSGAWAAWRSRHELRRFARDYRSSVLVVESAFLVVFGLFAAVRALNPAIYWGEKPMDFAILNAVLRSNSMPPADPWFAGEPLNYFYFGHALTANFAQLTGVSSAHAFNLAMATCAALLAVLICAVIHQASGRVRLGALGAALVVVGGNLAGASAYMAGWPDRVGFDYFWATSRVIPGTINEFPFWNLVFGDLHAHVLAMPLQAGVLYLGALWATRGAGPARCNPLILGLLSALVVGAVSVTSSWSLPTAAALMLGLLVTSWRQQGANWRGAAGRAAGWLAIMLTAYGMFLPFWVRYSSSAARHWGLETQSASVTDVLTMFGVFFALALPALALTLYGWVRRRTWRIAVPALVLLLAAAVGVWRSPAAGFYAAWLGLAGTVWLTSERLAMRVGAGLTAAAATLGMITETVFIWDRMNTVFKYYLDMWLMLGCGATLLAWVAWSDAPASRRRAITALATTAALASGFTSITALAGFLRQPLAPTARVTLDGMHYLQTASPLELEAYRWLNREIHGVPVVLEAQGPSYQAFGRVSMNTGLPTVLGWEYHLFQQGRSQAEIAQRAADVREIFDGSDVALAERLLQRYHVDLVLVGPLERLTYSAEGLAKFRESSLLEPVFQNRDVTIYARAGVASTVKTWIAPVPPAPPRLPFTAPLREPRGLAVGPGGTVVIADFGNRRVQRLGPDLTPIGAFGNEGSAAGEFRDPCGIAVDAAGTIWVADTWNHRLQQFTADGRPLREVHGGLYGPRGLALAASGALLVTDTGHHRVLRLKAGGELEVVVPPGLLDNPIGIAVNSHGEIHVADTGNRRIAVFDEEGSLVRAWPVGWRADPRLEPYLAIGPDDAIWVTDPAGQQVLLFTRAGAPIGSGIPSVPLSLPLGIAVLDSNIALLTDAATGDVVEVRRPSGAQRRPGSASGRSPGGTPAVDRLQTPTRNSSAR